MENVEIQGVEARRSFLKKVAYVAPAVVVLGSLTLPNSAQASTFTGEARVNPGDTLIGVSTVTGENGAVGATGGGTYRRVYKDGSTGDVQSYTGAQVVENKMGVFTWAQKFFGNILG